MRIFAPAPFDAKVGGGRSAQQGFRFLRRSAEHGFTSLGRSAEHGFTLVELMVVIAIMGFASAAVMLAVPDPRGRLVDDADRFAARLAAARDQAVIAARPAAIWVSPGAYGFETRDRDRWSEPADAPFPVTYWRAGTRALVGQDGKTGGRLMLSFDSTGLPAQPARITLMRDEESVAVTLDSAGRVRVGG